MHIGWRPLQSLVLATITIMVAAHGSAETNAASEKSEHTQGETPAELEQTVQEQARRIKQLESALLAVQDRLDQADRDSSRAGSGSADEGETVDRKYVDERIQDFENTSTNRFQVSGYGTTGLVNVKDESTHFGVSFNPGFHFRMTERLHLNAELEIGFEVDEDRETEFEFDFEFAQFDFLATDWLVISGGQFLTPFNSFGPRLHPTWINKLSSPPPIYGGGHGSGGFIPVLKTVGAMAAGGTALWSDDAKVNYALYVGNGPTAHELDDPPEADELLDIEFNNTPDLDDGVMFGGRLGFLPIRNLEFGVSYGTSDPGDARFHLIGVDAWYYWEGLELRGEFAYLGRDAKAVKENVNGYWLQAAYRLNRLFPDRDGVRGFANRLEPVIRWGQVLDFSPKNRNQLAIGLNYWLFESAPLKFTYELNDGAVENNRLLINFAYGF